MRLRSSYLSAETIASIMWVLVGTLLMLYRFSPTELEEVSNLWPIALIAVGVHDLFSQV
jgi:DMSO reductase anchor subunit